MCTYTLLPQPGKPCLTHVAPMAMCATCRAVGTHECDPTANEHEVFDLFCFQWPDLPHLRHPYGPLLPGCHYIDGHSTLQPRTPGLTDAPAGVGGGVEKQFLSNRLRIDEKCRLKETENPKGHCPAIVSLAEATGRQQG